MHLNLILPYPNLLQPKLFLHTTLATVFYLLSPCHSRGNALFQTTTNKPCQIWNSSYVALKILHRFLLLYTPFYFSSTPSQGGVHGQKNCCYGLCYTEQVDSYGCTSPPHPRPSSNNYCINPRPYGEKMPPTNNSYDPWRKSMSPLPVGD